jgi:hypothetical protein
MAAVRVTAAAIQSLRREIRTFNYSLGLMRNRTLRFRFNAGDELAIPDGTAKDR